MEGQPSKRNVEVNTNGPYTITWVNTQGYNVTRSFFTRSMLLDYIESLRSLSQESPLTLVGG
jgi:hypothetical protein